jgi:transposase
MEVLYHICCGLDVHAKTVVACLVKHGKKEVRTFGTMTDDLLQLSDWLVAVGCTHVAIESTGVYWKPVFNLLEGLVKVILVNARHIKAVPGRKTDVKDCEWLADLLRHGLLKASFIPPLEIRELRELTRYRQSLVRAQTAVANRAQKVIESGNIKLGQVAADALGVSGRLMLKALAEGETDAEKMANLARRSLKRKKPELKRALEGRLTKTQRWVLGELVGQWEELERRQQRVEAEIRAAVEASPDPFVPEAVKLIDTVPGIGAQLAQTIASEIGVDMKQFPSDGHISSWSGMCPGQEESAGKSRSGKTRKGNKYLREALVQAAQVASQQPGTYLQAQYQRLVRRMGKKKALVAVGHSILVMIYHMLSRKQTYQELGGDYFDRLNVEAQRQRLIRRLEALGLKVSVEELEPAA